ncbi:hypothetical protein CBS147346_9370 [Aspergillus niger]|nr:hypothetical protein CBS147346_9370 [Aspergillus niger]GLA27018.1 hypothetical protein AnigIFM63326_004205 [Aspergillus niger]
MKAQLLPRIGFLGLVGLLCLLLVHQTLQGLPDTGPSRIHARDLVVPVTPEVSLDNNLTARAVSGHLATRALDFQTAVNKGNGLYCRCKAKWQLSDESPWTNINELEDYYSRQSYGKVAGSEPQSMVSLRGALTAMGLPTVISSNNGKDGKLVPQMWAQTLEWVTEVVAGGRTTRTNHERTDGFYVNVMSPTAGLIIAEQNESPVSFSGRHCPIEKWSDVVWLNYAALAKSTGSSVTKLKYVIRTHIVNPDTKNVLEVVCGGPCPSWPGTTFDINQKKKGGVLENQNGLALLGTPNGGGAAWLLINHKQQLSRKMPVSVTAWTTSGLDAKGNPEPWYHMMFQFST